MSTHLQLIFIAGTLMFFGMILYFLRNDALSLKYTLIWLFSAFAMLIISIFPDVLGYIASILNFAVASNALFAFMIGFVIVILLSLTSIVSKQTERIKTLAQVNALLERRIRELENQILPF